MIQTINRSWALLLGIFMLMIGNGVQSTALGIRGQLEAFSTGQMSYVMSAYFLGFLGGSWAAPRMIRRVGHVRVFAALGSAISAVVILYPVLVDPLAWAVGRVMIGFCFAGVYVTAESWLNNATDNANRGKLLSLYVIVQMAGIMVAQLLVGLGDAGGYLVFILPSVVVSLAFAPILLSVQPTPAISTAAPLPMRQLIETSPLTSAGMVMLGGVYSIQIAMTPVYAADAGLSVAQIASLVTVIYLGALLAQFPIGWLSDRMDRRVLVIALALIGAIGSLTAFASGGSYHLLLAAAALVGGASNPLYALLIAYANDYLDPDDMASASAGYMFVHGLGAIAGPIVVGVIMTWMGPQAFWLQMGGLLLLLALYAGYRMTQRASVDPAETPAYVAVTPSASPVLMEVAQEEYGERTAQIQAEEDDEEGLP